MREIGLLIGRRYMQMLPGLMESAQHELRVALFQMQVQGARAKGWSGELALKLHAKAEEGKRVRVLLSSAGGGRAIPAINRHAALWLMVRGVEVRNLGPSRVCHAKVVLVDERVAIVGSHNWSWHSLSQNFEVSVLVDGGPLVARLVEHFDGLWSVAKKF